MCLGINIGMLDAIGPPEFELYPAGGFMRCFSIVLALVAVLVMTGTAHAFSAVPLPDSLVLLVTGAAGIAGYAWWVGRKR